MKSLKPLLEEHSFFAELPPSQLSYLVSCASNVRFAAGEQIFREGEEADHFYLLRKGKVALEIHVPQSGELMLDTLGEGEVLGFSWLFPPYRWVYDARAIEEVRAIALEGSCLRKKCDEDHQMGYELIKRFSYIMSERLVAARSRLVDVYGNSVLVSGNPVLDGS